MSTDRTPSESQWLSLKALIIALGQTSETLSPQLQTQLNQLGQTLRSDLKRTVDELVFLLEEDSSLGTLYRQIRDRLAQQYQAQPRKSIILPEDDPNLPEGLKNSIESGDRLALAEQILTADSSPAAAQAVKQAIQKNLPPNPNRDDDDSSWLRGFGA
ncbi:MAG: hypothetical protein AAGG51_15280 [Cyanobacteria bacterium P01_G01_bin.54]